MVKLLLILVLNFSIGLELWDLDISLLLRTISSHEILSGQNQLDESWTWALIMFLGVPNLPW
jgi:hypothetical protein